MTEKTLKLDVKRMVPYDEGTAQPCMKAWYYLDCYGTAVTQLTAMKAMRQDGKYPVKTRPYDIKAEMPTEVEGCRMFHWYKRPSTLIHDYVQKEGELYHHLGG